MKNSQIKNFQIVDLGSQPYRPVWELQKKLHARRIRQEVADTLIFVEHTPVYTVGKNGTDLHIIATGDFLKERQIEILQVDRGGDVTYHGPGQLVGYPIVDLHQHRQSISWYMRSLEEVFIRTLAHWDIAAERMDGYTGVWVGESKIVALGVRISRWVTMHGFALNVNTDLRFYDGIIPCGIFHRGVTSMQQLLGREINMDEVKKVVALQFSEIFGFPEVRNIAPEELFPVQTRKVV